MITRSDVISKASMDCLKELYSKVQPSVDWDDFMQQNKDYSKKYKEWEERRRKGEILPIKEFCGPRPYEFYYLPADTMKEISDSYVRAYELDSHANLLDIIEILKGYCKEPIVDKYIEGELREDGTRWPGHRGYEHPDNLEKELEKILHNTSTAKLIQEKFFEFLDRAGDFYSWNRDLNAFNTTVYLGPSPCSNKETVIKNWKLYRDKTITIDESVYIEDDEWK